MRLNLGEPIASLELLKIIQPEDDNCSQLTATKKKANIKVNGFTRPHVTGYNEFRRSD